MDMLPGWPLEMEKVTAAPGETETPAHQQQVVQRDGPGQADVLCKGRGHAPQGAPGCPTPSKRAPAALGGLGASTETLLHSRARRQERGQEDTKAAEATCRIRWRQLSQ